MYNHDLFFALVRAGLWQTELENKYIEQDYDWFHSVIMPGYDQTVLGLVAEASLRCLFAQRECTERNVALQIIEQVKEASKKHNEVLLHVAQLFRSEGIEPILLKGQGIANYYKDPSLRQCGDIDIFVKAEDYSKAHTILSETREVGKKNKESDKHYAVVIEGIEVELHRFTERLCNPFANRKFQKWTKEELWNNKENIVIDDVDISIPSVDYNLIYVFCHLWNHLEIAGIGLRQLCDFAMLIHENYSKADTILLEKKLREYNLLNAWQLVGAFIVTYLGLPCSEYPLYKDVSDKKIADLRDFVLRVGNFGQTPRNKFIESSFTKWKVIRPFYPIIYYCHHIIQIYPFVGANIIWRILKKMGIK